MSENNNDIHSTTLAETENYIIWKTVEPDNEETFHLEINNVTLHFFMEEWQEFVKLMSAVK
ncbi:MAG: hypothetical protein KIS80_10115 [Anaerolineales bacterium]|nr:hypothetical protein [Anaerolineales bacterium]